MSFSGRVPGGCACHLGQLRGEPLQHCHGRLRSSNLCRHCLCNFLPRLYCLCVSLSDHRHCSATTLPLSLSTFPSSHWYVDGSTLSSGSRATGPLSFQSGPKGCPWNKPQALVSGVDQKTSPATMRRVFCVLMSQSAKFTNTTLSHWMMGRETSIGASFSPSKEF